MATYVGTLRSPLFLAVRSPTWGGPGVLGPIGDAAASRPPIVTPPDGVSCTNLAPTDESAQWCANHCAGRGVRKCSWRTLPDGMCQATASCKNPDGGVREIEKVGS